MWLVLCDPGDAAALWAYVGLRARGLTALELVTPQALVCSLRSVHRVRPTGASFEIALADGRTLDSAKLRGVLNRLSNLPLDHLTIAPEAEARYAIEEMHALVLSLMASISSISLNRPSPRGLGGAWRPQAEWTLLAARAGLAAPALRLSSSRGVWVAEPALPRQTAIVLGKEVFGAELPAGLAQACVRLAQLSDTELIGIDLHRRSDGTLWFSGASALPDLRIGGGPLLDHLHTCLTRASAATA